MTSLMADVASVSAASSFHAVGSAEQVYVTGLGASETASLFFPNGTILYTQAADPQGGLLFRNVPPGAGYYVVDSSGAESASLIVRDTSADPQAAQPAPWPADIYNQSISDSGYSYLTTRDGTTLAIDVHPPTSPAGEPGLPAGTQVPSVPHGDFVPPYPTLIEYSGYGYADPAGPVNGIAVLANLMGFAVVDVNMRGTGCSGGAYDFFEPLQNLDGYDVVETIAHQPWVLHHKVGMMGISYGAISQLFTAQTNPPDLEAIAPLSTIDATATTLYPGGILNTGFAVAWAQQRQQEATPASATGGGQPYADTQIANGDTTCAANQALHGEANDLMAKIRANNYYNASVADTLDPVAFVNRIHVPVFMACQWEDEQTGGHCAQLVSHFTGTDQKWFTFTNGAHIDSLDPATYNRWYDFLELFVAHRAPIVNSALTRAAAPVVYQAAMGLPQNDVVTLPVDPVQALPTYDLALAAFERTPEVMVAFDNGAGSSPAGNSTPGNPYAAFQEGFPSLPVPGTRAATWYLGAGGTLSDTPPAIAGVDQYTSNASALPLTDYAPNGSTGGGGLWGDASQWQWTWEQNAPGTAVSYVSPPLASDTTVIGGGAVYAWVRSSTSDVDLQATVSEVRPDGHETFVQDGWIRASERQLSTSPNGSDNLFKEPSTLLNPLPTFTKADAAPMPSGQFVRVAIPLYYEGHVYRAGSRIRLTIAAPNGAQPVWSFNETEPDLSISPSGTSTVSVEYSPTLGPSSELVLPVVPAERAPTPLPPCPSLRNEPCRSYEAIVNTPGTP
ncbi:MAG: CocE/NonD family hydrolase [Thermoplasmatota archaeon]